jgi:hypothetical protein
MALTLPSGCRNAHDGKCSPFFHARTGKPVAAPRVLRAEDVRALKILSAGR